MLGTDKYSIHETGIIWVPLSTSTLTFPYILDVVDETPEKCPSETGICET